VLSFGGPPVFKPSAWEWTFRASNLKKRGDRAAARKLLDEGLEAWPASPSILYELGCMEAIEGNKDAALDALRHALERAPSLREYLETDDDLVSLHEEPEFQALVAG
jgi:tetratricopeptide (TPR) repeat protein